MDHETFVAWLKSVKACSAAVALVERNHWSLAAAWQNCPRGDWLLWTAAQLRAPSPKVGLAQCRCSRRALRFVPRAERRPLTAIRTAEAYWRGEASSAEVRTAADASYAAAADAAAYAAYAACYAADAADDDDAAAAAYATEQLACAKIVRGILSLEDLTITLEQEPSPNVK